MISQKSLIIFIKVNAVLWGIGHMFYVLYKLMLCSSGNSRFLFTFLCYVFLLAKNYFILNQLESSVKKVQPITLSEPPKEKYEHEFDHFIAKDTVIELFGLNIVRSFNSTSIITDIVSFIPLTFLFELVFDFFHYWTHRLCHRYAYWIHKRHHMHKHPRGVTVFYQDPLDLMITNVIPFFITSLIVPLSTYQLAVFTSYKTFIEISGHLGRRSWPTPSFSQFIWLPKLLGIELYSEDHDLHHTRVNCNYSKRFSIWDKLFGTFKKSDKIEILTDDEKKDTKYIKYGKYDENLMYLSMIVMICLYLSNYSLSASIHHQ